MMAVQHFTAIEYPCLDPESFIRGAIAHGFNIRQARELSGFSHGNWDRWLYGKTQPRMAQLERLYRIANDMGWVNG